MKINNKLIEKNILKACVTSESATSTSYNYFPVFTSSTGSQQIIKIGDKFTFKSKSLSFGDRSSVSTYGVEIGSGVSLVKINFSERFTNGTTKMHIAGNVYIQRNNTTTPVYVISDTVGSGDRYTVSGSHLIEVQEGDFIFIAGYKATKSASLTVEKDYSSTSFYIESIQ